MKMFRGIVVAGIPGADGQLQSYHGSCMYVAERPKAPRLRDLAMETLETLEEMSFKKYLLVHKQLSFTASPTGTRKIHVWTRAEWSQERVMGQLLAGYQQMAFMLSQVDQKGYSEDETMPGEVEANSVLQCSA